MKRLARCALAALLAASFAAPVYASPPPVKAPPAYVVTSALLPTPIVYAATSAAGLTPIVYAVTSAAGLTPIRPTPAPVPTVADAQAYALGQLGATQYACLYSIIQGESRWRVTVYNAKGSGAYGLGQAKPASKMAAFGADYMTNATTQLKWAIAYGQKRYGSLCAAAAFRSAHGWW